MNFKYTIYIGLLMLASGCSSYMTYFEIEPPRIMLKTDQTEMLFISRFDTSAFNFNQKKKTKVFNEGYKKYIQGVMDGFDLFVVDVEWMENVDLNIASKPEPLAKTDIQRLCKENGSSLLLVVEDFEMYRDKSVEVEEKDDGSKSRTANFFVIVNITMNLYDQEGELIDNQPIYDKRHLSSRSVFSGLLSVGPALGNRGKEIYPMLNELGAGYVYNFKLKRVTRRAKYYAKGKLEPVKEMMMAGNWENARRFLLTVYNETSDTKIKSRAAHNIYFVYMALGDQKGAMEWSWSN